MSRRAAALAAVALAGCAVVPPPPPDVPGTSFSGRMTMQVEAAEGQPARSMTAAFELQGRAAAGRMDLSTPLGSLIAQARWERGRVTLATPQGEQRFADLDAMTREVLGEVLPVAALFDWLAGQPWAGAASQPLEASAGFRQLGWKVDTAQLDAARLSAVREQPPVVTVRVKLDRP